MNLFLKFFISGLRKGFRLIGREFGNRYDGINLIVYILIECCLFCFEIIVI